MDQIVVSIQDVDHIARLDIVDRIAIISDGQRTIVSPALLTICILLRRTAWPSLITENEIMENFPRRAAHGPGQYSSWYTEGLDGHC